MSFPRSTGCLAALASFALLVAPSAAAEPDEPAAGVIVDAYETADGCPSEDVFRAQVERRARRPGAGAAMLRVAVNVQRERRDLVGTILLTDARGERSTRKVNASRCDEVVSALALVAALAVDDASHATEPAAEPEPDVPAPATAAASVVVDDAAAPRPAPKHERELVFRAGAQGAAQSGVAPDIVATVPVFVEIGLGEARGRRGLSIELEPSLRALGVFGGSDRTTVGTAVAELRWTSGALDGCPVTIHAGPASVVPCVRLEIGVLDAKGERIVPARSDSRLWSALALPVRLRLEASRHVFFELEGAVRTPLVRDRFVFQPDLTVFQAPRVGWTAAAGAGVRFP